MLLHSNAITELYRFVCVICVNAEFRCCCLFSIFIKKFKEISISKSQQIQAEMGNRNYASHGTHMWNPIGWKYGVNLLSRFISVLIIFIRTMFFFVLLWSFMLFCGCLCVFWNLRFLNQMLLKCIRLTTGTE